MFPRTDYGVTDSAYLPTTESEIVRFEWKMFRQNSSEAPFGPSNHWLPATANSLWEGFVPTFPRLRFSMLSL